MEARLVTVSTVFLLCPQKQESGMGRWLHGADAELTASKVCVCQSQLSCEATLLLLVGIRVTTGSSPEKSKVPLYDITPITRQGALVRAGSMELQWHFLQIPRGSQSRFLPPPTGGYVEREYVSALLQLNLKTEASATTSHSRLKAVGRSCPLRPMPQKLYGLPVRRRVSVNGS